MKETLLASYSFETNCGSFRDPAGRVALRNGEVFRVMEKSYGSTFDDALRSGLYRSLIDRRWLIAHAEVTSMFPALREQGVRVIKPDLIPCISYAYEWSFSQLVDAALLTLDIQRTAMTYGLSLKDASSHNVQFVGASPIFIDTTSFEKYQQDIPWAAYYQFCKHFIAPLALMSKVSEELAQLLKSNLDGIPLSFARRLLPKAAFFNLGIACHILLQDFLSRRSLKRKTLNRQGGFSKTKLLRILDSLEETVSGLKPKEAGSQWIDYYQKGESYSLVARASKAKILDDWCREHFANNLVALDIGGNCGAFSKRVAKNLKYVVTVDRDWIVTDKVYNDLKRDGVQNILPIVSNISNPSPGLGFQGNEHPGFLQRVKPDVVFMLGILHHLVLGEGVPFAKIGELVKALCRKYLVLEFVPLSDPMIPSMSTFQNRSETYSEEKLCDAISSCGFDLFCRIAIEDSQRSVLLWKLHGV